MRRMKRYQIANYKCLIIKYAKDDRYDKEGIATHDRSVNWYCHSLLIWNFTRKNSPEEFKSFLILTWSTNIVTFSCN